MGSRDHSVPYLSHGGRLSKMVTDLPHTPTSTRISLRNSEFAGAVTSRLNNRRWRDGRPT